MRIAPNGNRSRSHRDARGTNTTRHGSSDLYTTGLCGDRIVMKPENEPLIPSARARTRPPGEAPPEKEPRRTPKQDRSKETVSIILDATERVVRQGGVAAIKMREVARVAGVAAGTLYQYFASAEALLAAWEERELSRRTETFCAELTKTL